MNTNRSETGNAAIQAADTLPRKKVKLLNTVMSYVDVGAGEPVVFLHGNPTSSYLWRNIIPYISKYRRCLAPDLVGMGQSGKLSDDSYSFATHTLYLDAWFEAVGIQENITLVLHDWGSALGFYRAYRFPHQIKALVYMEALVLPRLWSDFPDGRDAAFRALRSEKGEEMIVENNFFIETVLPKSIIRKLSEEEMENYRRPFLNKKDRLPTLAFPREIPIEGEPAAMADIIDAYGTWAANSSIPKLFISATPGALITDRTLDFCRQWKNQVEVTVKGIHYIQEDSPAEIGEAIREFILHDLK